MIFDLRPIDHSCLTDLLKDLIGIPSLIEIGLLYSALQLNRYPNLRVNGADWPISLQWLLVRAYCFKQVIVVRVNVCDAPLFI